MSADWAPSAVLQPSKRNTCAELSQVEEQYLSCRELVTLGLKSDACAALLITYFNPKL